MSDSRTQEHFPRFVLIGAAGLVMLALMATLAARLWGQAQQAPVSQAVQARDVFFEDQRDGSIVVRDARDQRRVGVLALGQDGFVRATVRSLVRERKQHNRGPEIPFRISKGTEGRITLEDLATGRRVALDAFGPTNAAAFARFLAADGCCLAQQEVSWTTR